MVGAEFNRVSRVPGGEIYLPMKTAKEIGAIYDARPPSEVLAAVERLVDHIADPDNCERYGAMRAIDIGAPVRDGERWSMDRAIWGDAARCRSACRILDRAGFTIRMRTIMSGEIRNLTVEW